MSKFVLDAYAWLEYLEGTKNGELVNGLFRDQKNEFFTHSVTYAEVISVAKRKGLDVTIASKAILALSRLYTGDAPFYFEVGELHGNLRRKIAFFGLADTFVLLTARKLGARVITGDPHFKEFKDVLFLGQKG